MTDWSPSFCIKREDMPLRASKIIAILLIIKGIAIAFLINYYYLVVAKKEETTYQ
jgi:hypothetical protein